MAHRIALKMAALGGALLLSFAGCGGGASDAREPATAHAKKSSPASREAESSADEEEEEEAPAALPCADGTCTTCGKGICPAGFYCDESAKGGAACSWLPQCAEHTSCACLGKALGSACKCQEQNGGQHVSCD